MLNLCLALTALAKNTMSYLITHLLTRPIIFSIVLAFHINNVSAAEAPGFLEAPESTLTVTEHQSAMFTCNVYGAPKPSLIWQKGEALVDVRDLHDHRINVLPNGNLLIQVFANAAFHKYDFI